jgi:hypothetical protein
MVAAGLAETLNARGGGIRGGLSQRLPVKAEPTKVPRERHGRNPGHSWPGRMSRTRPLQG